MFTFRNEPLRTLYLIFFTTYTLFVRLPIYALVSIIPFLRPRRAWSRQRTWRACLIKVVSDLRFKTGIQPPPSDPARDSSSPEITGFAWVDGIPTELVTGELARLAQVNDVAPAKVFGYWYGARDEHGRHGQPAAKGERVIYFLHGGGHVRGSAHPAEIWSGLMKALVANYNFLGLERVFGLEYRLASSAPYPSANPFPASLIDAVSGYRYLVETLGFRPSDIVLAGDSSGGHLANNVVRYLVQAQLPGLAPPRALVLLSPTMDWGNTHLGTPASTMDANRRSDFVRNIMLNGYSATSMRGRLAASELATNAWLSPASLQLPRTAGLFANYPPTIIFAGGAEQTVDAMRTFRDRLVRDNGEEQILYLEYPDAFHDWLLIPWVEPEHSEAFKALGRWLERVYGLEMEELVPQ